MTIPMTDRFRISLYHFNIALYISVKIEVVLSVFWLVLPYLFQKSADSFGLCALVVYVFEDVGNVFYLQINKLIFMFVAFFFNFLGLLVVSFKTWFPAFWGSSKDIFTFNFNCNWHNIFYFWCKIASKNEYRYWRSVWESLELLMDFLCRTVNVV